MLMGDRCQDAPGSAATIAPTRPWWASEMTSRRRTGCGRSDWAAGDQTTQERQPAGAVLIAGDVQAEYLPRRDPEQAIRGDHADQGPGPVRPAVVLHQPIREVAALP